MRTHAFTLVLIYILPCGTLRYIQSSFSIITLSTGYEPGARYNLYSQYFIYISCSRASKTLNHPLPSLFVTVATAAHNTLKLNNIITVTTSFTQLPRPHSGCLLNPSRTITEASQYLRHFCPFHSQRQAPTSQILPHRRRQHTQPRSSRTDNCTHYRTKAHFQVYCYVHSRLHAHLQSPNTLMIKNLRQANSHSAWR